MLVIGHRGAKGLALENTAASIEAALDYGVDMVEIDLHLSKDGVIVLLHDSDPVVRGGESIEVAEQTHQQIQAYMPDLLTLEAAIKLVNRRCVIMLEFKDDPSIEPTIALLKKYLAEGWQPADFMFASFKFHRLQQLHAALPKIPVVVLDGWSSIRATRRARKLGTRYLSMDQRYLWWGVIRSLSRHGYKVFCYPHHKLIHIKHAKPIKWATYGLYGVITDYPNLFRDKQPPKV